MSSSSPTPAAADLPRQLEAEQQRRRAAERMLRQIAESWATRPLSWLHRLTRRGPDMAAVRAFLGEESIDAIGDSAASTPTTDSLAADARQLVVDDFHRLYYESGAQTWQDTWWLGTQVLKLPLDLWSYQELIYATRPDLIIECGTKYGGSAKYLANICDLIDHGRVHTIDINELPGRPDHPRINYVTGSSTDPEIVAEAAAAAATAGPTTMVILDSDHSEAHVYAELQAYAPLVSVGSYLIVEDTNVHGRPVRPDHPAGPGEAVDRFLAERDDYAVATAAHKFLVTFNPNGLLQRLR